MLIARFSHVSGKSLSVTEIGNRGAHHLVGSQCTTQTVLIGICLPSFKACFDHSECFSCTDTCPKRNIRPEYTISELYEGFWR